MELESYRLSERDIVEGTIIFKEDDIRRYILDEEAPLKFKNITFYKVAPDRSEIIYDEETGHVWERVKQRKYNKTTFAIPINSEADDWENTLNTFHNRKSINDTNIFPKITNDNDDEEKLRVYIEEKIRTKNITTNEVTYINVYYSIGSWEATYGSFDENGVFQPGRYFNLITTDQIDYEYIFKDNYKICVYDSGLHIGYLLPEYSKSETVIASDNCKETVENAVIEHISNLHKIKNK